MTELRELQVTPRKVQTELVAFHEWKSLEFELWRVDFRFRRI